MREIDAYPAEDMHRGGVFTVPLPLHLPAWVLQGRRRDVGGDPLSPQWGRQLRSCVAAESRQSAPRGVPVLLAAMQPPPVPAHHVALLLFTSWIRTSLPLRQAVTSAPSLHSDIH
ncbi:hypothetical protein E2C01_006858 [Portunus trituberculatus]|uniref:Uncharacterized protein n=1 Tax=Portunus trituberculatus TaxID=210409 RepID=A0A5B7CYG4_PORTR|nr:hypothetical protein [Portunus trituberculatus]